MTKSTRFAPAILIRERSEGNWQDYRSALRSLRHVWRMARKLRALPESRLSVSGDDVADAEYVTEWLHIVLCRVCGLPEVSMPALEDGVSHAEQFRWFIQKAARQAGVMYRALMLGRIEKDMFGEKAWEGLDSAETFLGSFLSENVYLRKRWRR